MLIQFGISTKQKQTGTVPEKIVLLAQPEFIECESVAEGLVLYSMKIDKELKSAKFDNLIVSIIKPNQMGI